MEFIRDESLTNFEFWSGAKDRANLLTYSELEELDSLIPDFFDGTPTETQINNLFWFDFDSVCQLLGTTEEELDKRAEEGNE